MQSLSIARKDLQVFIRDRGAVFMLFMMPLIFIVFFAYMGKSMAADSDARLYLPVVNQDPQGAAAQDFISLLQENQKLNVALLDQAAAEHQLDEAELDWALFVPAGFSAKLAADQSATVLLLVHPDHEPLDRQTVERHIISAGRSMTMMDYMDDSLKQVRLMRAMIPEDKYMVTEERIQRQMDEQQAAAEERPLVTVIETTPAGLAGQAEPQIPNLGQTVVVGMATLFVFLAAQTTAQSIFEEKRLGSFRRLLAAPISRSSLLTGKLLPNLLLTLLQIVIIFFTGFFLIPLVGVPPLDLTSDPLALALVSVALALCSTSLGIFLAGIARTEGQVGGLSSAILWIAGLLGGSLIPVFFFPPLIDKIAHLLPQYWANQAYYGLIFRGETLADVWPAILILLGFTLAFFAVGLWRFDFD